MSVIFGLSFWAMVVAALVSWIAAVARENRQPQDDAPHRQLLLLGGLLAQEAHHQQKPVDVVCVPGEPGDARIESRYEAGLAEVRIIDRSSDGLRTAQSIRREQDMPIVQLGEAGM
jgi:hypothetical protein